MSRYPGIAKTGFAERRDRHGAASHASSVSVDQDMVAAAAIVAALDKLEAIVQFVATSFGGEAAVFRTFETSVYELSGRNELVRRAELTAV